MARARLTRHHAAAGSSTGAGAGTRTDEQATGLATDRLTTRHADRLASFARRPPVRSGALPPVVIDFGYSVLRPFVRIFRGLGITPNALTLASLPVTILAAVALGVGQFGVGGGFLLLAFCFDAWDGLLARETAVASDAGEMLDATVDRYNDIMIMLGFLYYYRNDVGPWLLASAALIGTIIVSYTRAKGETFGVDPNFGVLQRHERALCLGLGALSAPAVAHAVSEPHDHPLYYSMIAALTVVAVGTNVTALRRTRFVIASLGTRRGGRT
jgi:CDP-diacylglycerol--glycerol-3-phosphate 3-phosphatidyltransferase